MPLRIIGYDGANYRDQIYYVSDEAGKRRKNKNPRYPVVTLVLYFGIQKHWDKPLTLHESLKGMPEKLKKYVSDYKVNLFEIAWLSDEQVEKFQSDFRIVADYFVQKRKHKEYVPSAREIIHVREVLQMMSVFTQDHRFEEAYQEALKEGKEVRNMCEVLDKIENRGVQKGVRKGIRKGVRKGRILEYIDIRREDGFSDQEILEGLQEKFHLTAEQAEKYAGG